MSTGTIRTDPCFHTKQYTQDQVFQVQRDLTRRRYGYHMPRTNARDNFYKKIEEERAAKASA